MSVLEGDNTYRQSDVIGAELTIGEKDRHAKEASLPSEVAAATIAVIRNCWIFVWHHLIMSSVKV